MTCSADVAASHLGSVMWGGHVRSRWTMTRMPLKLTSVILRRTSVFSTISHSLYPKHADCREISWRASCAGVLRAKTLVAADREYWVNARNSQSILPNTSASSCPVGRYTKTCQVPPEPVRSVRLRRRCVRAGTVMNIAYCTCLILGCARRENA